MSVPEADTVRDILMRTIARPDPVILEIGCNDGTHTSFFLSLFPEATIHCFEPDARAVARFKSRDDLAGRVHLHACAIGAADGQAPFYPSGGKPAGGTWWLGEWDLSGSLRRPTGHLFMHPWCKFGASVTVPVRTLDSWAREHLPHGPVDFIWADVQGAEADVIAGARETLARTHWFYTEYNDLELYEGQPRLAEIAASLSGFVLDRQFQHDALFRRAA